MEEKQIIYLEAKNGSPTVEVEGYLLHSKYNPEREAEQFISRELEVGYQYILFGYGLGYNAKILQQTVEGDSFIIYDPLYKKIYSGENKIEVVTDIEDVKKFLGPLLRKYNRNFKVIVSPNYQHIVKKEYTELMKLINKLKNENKVNENTLKHFSEIWQENYILNLKYLPDSSSLKDLIGKYNAPVVLASGGPSLSKQLPLLKEIKDKVIIIAAGSTINALLAENIEPDYVVSIDGGEINYNYFKGIVAQTTKLIYSLGNYHKIQSEFKKKYAFIYAEENRLQKYLEEVYCIKLPKIMGGGSVATFALHIASLITKGPIALIGQDLAYTNDTTHVKNHKHNKEANATFYRNRGAFQVEDYYGNLVYTDSVFTSMSNNFNLMYDILKAEHTIVNCTEGGMRIENIPNKTFIEFIDEYVTSKYNKCVCEEGNNQLTKQVLFKNVELELERYQLLKKTLNQSIKVLEKARLKMNLNHNAAKKLDEFDEEISKLTQKLMMDRIIEPITVDTVLKNEGVKTQQQIIKQNLELYKRLLESTIKCEEYTNTLLKSLH